jgi:hypothetical protein
LLVSHNKLYVGGWVDVKSDWPYTNTSNAVAVMNIGGYIDERRARGVGGSTTINSSATAASHYSQNTLTTARSNGYRRHPQRRQLRQDGEREGRRGEGREIMPQRQKLVHSSTHQQHNLQSIKNIGIDGLGKEGREDGWMGRLLDSWKEGGKGASRGNSIISFRVDALKNLQHASSFLSTDLRLVLVPHLPGKHTHPRPRTYTPSYYTGRYGARKEGSEEVYTSSHKQSRRQLQDFSTPSGSTHTHSDTKAHHTYTKEKKPRSR